MRVVGLSLLFSLVTSAVVVDRIAIVVNNRAIKDTDIERDLRLTDFLNGDTLVIDAANRKKAAQRLIDQMIIRREVELGNYAAATPQDVDAFLNTVKQQRFSGEAAYSDALKRYGITEQALRQHLQWQLTVLNFINQRFGPAVIINNTDIDAYAKAHNVDKDQAQKQLTEQRVNQDFDSWLNRAEKRAAVDYHEEGLK